MIPDLHDFDAVAINSSGGKDSQTALAFVVEEADRQHYSLGRLVVVHADLGEMEWPGTKELAEKQAKHYGLKFVVVKYRTAKGEEIDLLEYVRRRGKWPSSTTRYCTSEFKRGPCLRAITALKARHAINVYGFRAQESPARAKRLPWSLNKRASNKTRSVYDWLPIHEWTEDRVWQDIKNRGVPHHGAYDLGMPRLSCRFCIFSPRDALLLAAHNNLNLLAKYVQVEKDIGHDFQHRKPLAVIQNDVWAGVKPDKANMSGCWNM